MANVPIASIIAELTQHYGASAALLRSASRHQPLAHQRQVGMWLARQLTSQSLTQIARAFGRIDHSTVLFAVEQVEQDRAADPAVLHETETLRHRIACRTPPVEPSALAVLLLRMPAAERAASGEQIGQLCLEVLRLTDALNLAQLKLDLERNKETTHV